MRDGGTPAASSHSQTGGVCRIGLALGGGGARGLAHIAVLEVFDELGIRPARIAGTSIGSIVGVAYASGLSGADLRDYALALFRRRSEVLGRLWRLRSTTRFTDILAPTLANPAQLNAERFLSVFLPEEVPHDFADLKLPFVAVASDFYGWRAVGLDSGDLRHAVAASMALPMMFRPVIVDGRVMVDGGITDPLPFGFVREDCDLVVAVDVVTGPRERKRKVPTPYDSVFGSMQLLMQAVVAAKIAQRPPDILVRPDIGIFRVLDFLHARTILKASQPAKDDLKRRLEAVLENA
jgi:NTE family protein